MLKPWHLDDVAGRQRSPPAAGGMDDDESTTGSYRYIADQDKRVRRGQGTVESGQDAVSACQMPLEMQTLIGLGSQPGECARSLRARYASTAVCEGASRQRAATKATGTRRARMRASRQPETYAGRQSSPPAEEHGR